MALLGHLLQRLLWALGLLVAVVVLNFLLIQLAPGDPAEVIAGEMGGATEEMLAEIRARYGLDQPLPVQLWRYVSRAARGDLGRSLFFDAPVTTLILERMPATVLLVLSSLLVSVLVGTWLGVLAARNPRGWLSQSITVLALVGYSAPVFWTGILLLLLFALAIPIFPASGMSDVTRELSALGRVLDVLHHLVLPTLTLAIIYLAQYSRLARASMLEVLGMDYIRTARAKGLAEPTVVYKHALRNAILPVVTIAGLQFSQLLSGAVLVETVFNWPGLGRLAFDSILRRDHPVVLGILFCSALLVVVANILTDLCYRLVDPRIRVGGAG